MAGRVEIRLKPSARRNAITVDGAGRLSAAVTSPPVDGKANVHLVKLFAEVLGVPRSSCTIVRGHTSRSKLVAVDGMSAETIIERVRASDSPQ